MLLRDGERGIATANRVMSVCLSVRDVEQSWSHKLEFFDNGFTGCSTLCRLITMDLLQRERHTVFAGIVAGCRKSRFRRTKALISMKRCNVRPRPLLRVNTKSYTRFWLVPKSRGGS